MKSTSKITLTVILLLFLFRPGLAQKQTAKIVSADTIRKQGYTLNLVNKSPGFSEQTLNRLKETFFTVYPAEVKKYNKDASKEVTFIIDPGYDGVAAAANGTVWFNPEWLTKNPEDIDVVTHEGMHIVQAYPHNAGPGWVTEGIADYVRFKMGVNNVASGWSLPEFKQSHKYTDAYRVTARFFVWIENKYDKKLVKKLDIAMRSRTYTDQFWKKNTGKTVDELWSAYQQAPSI